MFIPIVIDNEEILVRFIFRDNFKKNIISEEKLNPGSIFLDSRQCGVSLQRYKYSSEDLCKQYAKKIPKQYVGVIVFKKIDFDSLVKEYKKERCDFESKIEYSPLDDYNNYILKRSQIRKINSGNPSHADILYINPAMQEFETINSALRLFSRKLERKCTIIIDPYPEKPTYLGIPYTVRT
ncbi:MAG: hypothetical protein H6Q14_902 [Bacteroidetes bacterium]|nr:hypothetical protein [Bacteroidota bacterium]